MDARVKPEHDEGGYGKREQNGIISLHPPGPPVYLGCCEPARRRDSTPDMRATPEFLKFTELFHQDAFDIHEDEDEVVDTALESLSMQEQADLRSFLASTIASDASDDQLLDLWNNARADFLLTEPSQARDFFRCILRGIPL